ncbi:MAG: CatA-like O-acetyltransferase [Bacteroidales bacterium]|nr:CatA-like O-acetyltransferase [Bacteroidales bacterium]
MKRKIDIDQWERKELFRFFKDFEEPYYGISTDLECTAAYAYAKSKGMSFFSYYLYLVLKAVNRTEAMKYRIEGEELFYYEKIDGSATIDRPDGTFGFSLIPYMENLEEFLDLADGLHVGQFTTALQDLFTGKSA